MSRVPSDFPKPEETTLHNDLSQVASAHPKWVTNLLIRATNLSERISGTDNDTIKNDTEISVLEKHSQALDTTKYNIFALLWHAACLHFICQSTERLADKYKQNAQTFKERFEKLPAAIKNSITAHCPEWLKKILDENNNENVMITDKQLQKITDLTDKMEAIYGTAIHQNSISSYSDVVYDADLGCWISQIGHDFDNAQKIGDMLQSKNILFLDANSAKDGQIGAGAKNIAATQVSIENIPENKNTGEIRFLMKLKENNPNISTPRKRDYPPSSLRCGIANYNGTKSVVLYFPTDSHMINNPTYFRLIIPVINDEQDLDERQKKAQQAVSEWVNNFPELDLLDEFASQWENLDKK